MEFKAEYNHKTQEKKLIYDVDSYSFDMEPVVYGIDFEVIINSVALSVLNKEVIQLWGFCPYGNWIKSNCQLPKAKPGILKIIDNRKSGFSYGLNKKDWLIYVNVETGWVCIGNPEHKGEAVECIKNCIAVIDDKKLVSLWLKPELLPQEIL